MSGVGISARSVGSAMNRFYVFYIKQTKIFKPKIFRIWFSLKGTFRCSEDVFRGHINLRTRLKTACSQSHKLASGMWNWNTKINESEINTFKFHLFKLSSSDWTVRLMLLIWGKWASYYSFLTVNIFVILSRKCCFQCSRDLKIRNLPSEGPTTGAPYGRATMLCFFFWLFKKPEVTCLLQC